MADGEDAQRRLEQQSLRNVRALVDKLQHDDHPVRALVPGLVVLLIMLVALGVLWLWWFVFVGPPVAQSVHVVPSAASVFQAPAKAKENPDPQRRQPAARGNSPAN